MKTLMHKLTLTAAVAAAALGAPSCTDNFEEINTNPNTMSEGMATPYNMLEYLIYEPAQWNDHYSMLWNGELVQYQTYTTTAAKQIHVYKVTDAEFSQAWNAYGRFALNARHMYELAVKTDDNACRAIALTLEVMQIANQVSLFGDIPYSEAFGLRGESNNSQPKFDTQQEVFEQMIAKLDQANHIYRGKEGTLAFQKPGLDGIYGGDLKKWQKFNNSLRLRLLCRVSGRPEMNVGPRIQEMLDDNTKWPLFTSNDDNATVTYTGIAPYVNYYYDKNIAYTSLNDHRLTRHMRKMLVEIDDFGDDMYCDPRIGVMFRMNNTSYNENGNWLGAISGGTPDVTYAQGHGTAYFNYDLYLIPTNPTTFMDYAEVQFILAEAAQRGLIAGGENKAKEYYYAAVNASLERWADISQQLKSPVVLDDKTRTDALESQLVDWNAWDNKLELIGNQKYVALFMVGFEAFHEIHRTGYPVLTIGAGTLYNDFKFPTRFAYPPTTIASNYTNCSEALSRMGADVAHNNMHVNLWWSKDEINEKKYSY